MWIRLKLLLLLIHNYFYVILEHFQYVGPVIHIHTAPTTTVTKIIYLSNLSKEDSIVNKRSG